MSTKGWIYIASNPAFDSGYLKIGMTQKMPELRLQELQTTGVPEPFTLEYSCLVEAAQQVETNLHRHFSENRSATSIAWLCLRCSERRGSVSEGCEGHRTMNDKLIQCQKLLHDSLFDQNSKFQF
jgi:hypothetical protein